MPHKGTLGGTCDQRVESHVSWKVEHFFSLSEEVGDKYDSPIFHFLGRAFCLRLYPNGMNSHKSEGWIGLFLIPMESCPPMEVEYTLGIQTAEGKIQNCVKFANTFREEDTGFGEPNYLKRRDLLVRRQELAPSDAVTFTVTMKKNGPQSIARTTSEVAVQTSPEDVDSDGKDENRPLEKTGTKEIAVQTTPEDVDNGGNDDSRPAEKTDFATFCQNIEEVKGKDCDVTLEVGGMKFRVHKWILEARTPVLAALFSDNTAEAETAVVCVEDCHPEPFEVFLRFAYSGVAENLNIDNAADVYYVADKYDLPRLKEKCVRHMLSNLTTGSVCRVIDMADRHGEELLKERATEFLVENAREIFQTSVWRKFTEENRLAYDLYNRVHKNWKYY